MVEPKRSAVSASAVLARCGLICPAGAGSVQVHLAPRRLDWAWRGPFVAIALPWGIYVRDREMLESGSPVLGRVILHELVHVEQWHRLGMAAFVWRYFTEYWRGRRRGRNHLEAYAAISLEWEARLRAGPAAGRDLGPAPERT